MKVNKQAIIALFLSTTFAQEQGNAFRKLGSCSGPDALDFSETIGMKVEKIGAVPTETTDPWSYNMMVADNFEDKVFFINQLMGKIYKYVQGEDPVEIFDMATSEIPAGLTLNFEGVGVGPGQTNFVHMMSDGFGDDTVYIVFSSTTLPEGYTEADGKLPAADEYPGYFCGNETLSVSDLYRVGTIPDCVSSGPGINATTVYDVFYEYKLSGDTLSDPSAFFVQENQLLPGHLGGGMVTTEDGKILWSVGDCLMFGTNGHAAPQIDSETCGKILSIDPENPGSYEVVAKGVRNSQQMRLVETMPYPLSLVVSNKHLVFMDIGGVTAEEVNSMPLSDISSKITNFGWGVNEDDGIAREGTFSVTTGNMGILGTEPPCDGDREIGESGFAQPWIQFGRTAEDFFYAISSFAVACRMDKLKLIWSEFNTGLIMGTTEEFCPDKYGGPSKAYKIKLYDDEGNYLEGGLNDLVMKELGEVGYYRGDPRLFHYPDGTAGAFIERTGVFYKLTEIEI